MDQYLPAGLSLSLHSFFTAMGSLQPYMDWTVLYGPDYFLEEYGWKKSYVFLGLMALAYPLGLIMHLLPYGNIRHAFSFVTGAAFLQVCWGVHWIHTPLTCFVTYAMLKLCSPDKVQQVVPTFLMTYLAIAHFQHQFTVTNYLGMDVYFTCSQMILTQKLYMLAYNVHDGYLLAKAAKDKEMNGENKEDNKYKKNYPLKAAQSCSQFALSECLSLLEFLGYAFCFSTVLVGPAFEFSHYKSACDGSLHYTINPKDGTRQLKGKSIPYNILPTLVPLIKCVVLVVFSSIFDRAFNYKRLTDPFYFNLTAPHRHFFNWATNFIQRMKVYFTWLFAEGSCNIWYVVKQVVWQKEREDLLTNADPTHVIHLLGTLALMDMTKKAEKAKDGP